MIEDLKFYLKNSFEQAAKDYKLNKRDYSDGKRYAYFEALKVVEKLSIQRVSQQSELLAFEDWVNKNTTTALKDGIKLALENYKKANCG